MKFLTPVAGTYKMYLGSKTYNNRGMPCVLRFTTKGKNPSAQGTAFGLIVDYIRLVPAEQVITDDIVIYAADGKPDYTESGAAWQDADAEQFFDAAYRNCEYVLQHFPMDAPRYSKGQRMNEHIVMENMAWFQEMYPERAPKLLLPAIETWADKMIGRSDNLWGAHMAAAIKAGDQRDYWTGSALDQQEIHGFNNNSLNEPGSIAGFQAAALAAARVIRDPQKQEQLRAIGTWSIDGMFGRNPYGRTIFFSCTRTVQPDGTPDYKDRNTDLIVPGHEQKIEGTDLGWMERDTRIGSGVLAIARGRIDASPKEWAYPYNPNSPGGYDAAADGENFGRIDFGEKEESGTASMRWAWSRWQGKAPTASA